MTADLLALAGLIALLVAALTALLVVTGVTAWLDSPRQPEPDRSRGTAPADAYAPGPLG